MQGQPRPATIADAAALAEVHVRTWQTAYAGQLPADVLASLSVERRQQGWARTIADRQPKSAVLVVERDGAVAGFVACGPSRDTDAPPDRGEVYAIYVAAAHWRAGIGRTLHDVALETLRANGFHTATLWVLRSNTRARDFYSAVGWHTDGTERTENLNGAAVVEVRYARSVA